MLRTTVYFPEDLKRRLHETAALEGRSEAAVIRAAVTAYVAPRVGHRPRLPLFNSGQPDFADRVDEYLVGFGE